MKDMRDFLLAARSLYTHILLTISLYPCMDSVKCTLELLIEDQGRGAGEADTRPSGLVDLLLHEAFIASLPPVYFEAKE